MKLDYFELEFRASRKRSNLDLEDLESLIDISLDNKDRYWFEKLAELKVNSTPKTDIIEIGR